MCFACLLAFLCFHGFFLSFVCVSIFSVLYMYTVLILSWLHFVRNKLHCEAKKLHHFIFVITLSYLSLFEQLLVYIYPNKFGTK